MKKIITMIFVGCTGLLLAQDALAGSYRATAQQVQYEFYTRVNTHLESGNADGSTSLNIQDSYGLGIEVEAANIPAGYNFGARTVGPIGLAEMNALQYYLYVTFDEDGSGEIADSQVLSSQTEDCVSEVVLQPLDDELMYSSNLDANVTVQETMVTGQPNPSPYVGQTAGTWSVSESSFFALFPETPTPVIAEAQLYGDEFVGCYFPCVESGAEGQFTPGSPEAHGFCGGVQCAMTLHGFPGMPHPGATSGYVVADPATSFAPSNNYFGTIGDYHIEWHYVDGTVGETGLGDDVDLDEDGDGSNLDFILGYPSMESTATKASCTAQVVHPVYGAIEVPMTFDFPILGNVIDVLDGLGMGDCVDYNAGGVDTDPGIVNANSFYVMGTDYAQWGGFLTWNALNFAATEGNPIFAANDSGSDLNPADISFADLDGDGIPETAVNSNGGRMVMSFDPTCIPAMQGISVLGELTNVGGLCSEGDVTEDGAVNVLDVIATVTGILDQSYVQCGDLNQDGTVNIFDVIIMVDNILGGQRLDADATNVKFQGTSAGMTMTADGHVDAIQMTISHGSDFSLDLTDKAMVADYRTDGNSTTLIIVNPSEEFVFNSTGDYKVEEVIAATSEGAINADISDIAPVSIALGAAYPNPFNPSTSFDLNVGVAGNVSVMVYNVNGQLVDVLYDGYKDAGAYNMTLNGQSLASGMYIVKANSADLTVSQKVMLVK